MDANREQGQPLPTLAKTVFSKKNLSGSILLGAAVGAGLPAISAEQGGADFVVLLNAGRFRVRGLSSLAAYLPVEDCNQLVLDVGRAEVLRRVSIPVFAGLTASDPRLDLAQLTATVKRESFFGVANFPSVVLLDGRVRSVMEHHGIGFSRECELMRQAVKQGLATLAYVTTNQEALAMAAVGVQKICVNLGFTSGGRTGTPTHMTLEEAAEMTLQVLAGLPASITTFVEGGPITTPDEAMIVIQMSKINGCIGGSTIDRLPLEQAVEQSARTFKALSRYATEVEQMKDTFLGDGQKFGIIGRSASLRGVLSKCMRVAGTRLNVLISGENGTGKELIAQGIHQLSHQADRKMVVVNCAAIPPDLLESEFFGHEKGAYTGALSRRKGYFEEADGSTLFLDEIGELDFSLQAKLLRVVETQEIRPVGSSSTQSVDVRIIAATNRNFHDEINAGRFREDLFYRLAELEVTVPPLRERISDISLLVDWFLDEIKAQVNSNVVELDREAYRLLVNHDWPGNVRELRNVLSRAALGCEGSVIHARHLDFGSRLHADQNQEKQPVEEINTKKSSEDLNQHLSEAERIYQCLRRNNFKRRTTALELGITERTLYNKIKRLGIKLI